MKQELESVFDQHAPGCLAALSDESGAGAIVEVMLRDAYQALARCIDGSGTPRGTARGQFRTALDLSADRLTAVAREERPEVLQERVAAALLAPMWCNQFCSASGAGGGRTEAADLARRQVQSPHVPHVLDVLDLRELKSWTAPCGREASVLWAPFEAFKHAAAVVALAQRFVAPYADWPPFRVRIGVLAPAQYFDRFGNAGFVRRAYEVFDAALRTIANIELLPPGVLGPMTRSEFFQCFDKGRVAQLIAAGRPASSAVEVLKPDRIPELRRWIADALRSPSALDAAQE